MMRIYLFLAGYLLLAIAILVLGTVASAASLTLDTNTLYGLPGETVGFGFTITSTPDSVHDNGNIPYLVITSAAFNVNAGTNPVGVFTPFIMQSFTVIGPDAGNGEVNPFSQLFDASLMTGIGSYTINSFQSIGDKAHGQIVLTYDEYSLSPNDTAFDPTMETLVTGQTLSAGVGVVVGTAPAPNGLTTPEPGAMFLAAVGLMILGGYRRSYSKVSHLSSANMRKGRMRLAFVTAFLLLLFMPKASEATPVLLGSYGSFLGLSGHVSAPNVPTPGTAWLNTYINTTAIVSTPVDLHNVPTSYEVLLTPTDSGFANVAQLLTNGSDDKVKFYIGLGNNQGAVCCGFYVMESYFSPIGGGPDFHGYTITSVDVKFLGVEGFVNSSNESIDFIERVSVYGTQLVVTPEPQGIILLSAGLLALGPVRPLRKVPLHP